VENEATSGRDTSEGLWLRLGPAARLLGVSINTLRRWSDSGRVPCYRSAGGHRRYNRKELEGLLGDHRSGATGGPPAPGKARRPADPAAVERLEQRARDLELLVEAGIHDGSARDTRRILHSVVRRLARVTGAPVVDIYAVEDGVLRALVSFDHGRFDRDWEGTQVPLADFPCSLKAVTERRISVATSLDDPILTERGRESLARWRYESQLSAPLLAHDTVIGLLELSDYRPRDYQEHIGLIQGLALAAGHAIENATLFEQVEHRNEILRELVDLGALVGGAHDVRELVRTVARRLVKTLKVADCDIFILEDGVLTCRASCEPAGFDDSVLGWRLDLDEFPTTREAIATGDVMVMPDLGATAASVQEQRVVGDFGFCSEVCIPLMVDGEARGLIDVFDATPRDYEDVLDFLRTVGQVVAGALHKSLLVEQLADGNRRLALLVESGLEFGSSLDVDQVLRSVAERMRSITAADSCDVYRLVGDSLETLMSVDRTGIDSAEIGSRYSAVGHTAARAAIATRVPFVIEDATIDPRLTDADRQYWRALALPASARLPLVAHDEVIGLVSLFDTHPRRFEHLDTLQGLAQIAAQALDNATLLERAEDRTKVLRELVELGAIIWETQDVEVLSRTVAQRLAETIDVASCEIFRLRDGILTCETSYNLGQGFDEDRLGEQLEKRADYPTTFAAVDALEVFSIASADEPGLTDEERRVFAEWGYESELVVPLAVEGRLVGMIDVFDTRPRRFEAYLDFMRSVGQMVAGAFENAGLIEQLGTTNQELETLVQSGLEFGSTLDLERIYNSVAERMRAVVDAACCDIYAMDGDVVRGLASVERSGVDSGFPGTAYTVTDFSLSRSPAATDIQEIADIRDDGTVTEIERSEWMRWGYVSGLRLPLVIGGNVIGFVVLFDDRPRRFEHLGLLRGLAQIAAQAVSNATLYRRLDRSTQRLQLVNEASLELSSTLSLRGVLSSTAQRLCSVTDVPCCDIYILDDNLLRCVASVRDGVPDLEWEGTTSPVGEWASDKLAIMSRQTVALTDRNDPKRSPEEVAQFAGLPWESQLNVPLIANDRVIGVLELFDRRKDRLFSVETIATVEAVCRSAALAIDNAHLFEQMQARRGETELLNAIAQRTAASLDIGDIASATAEQLRQLVAWDRASVAIVSPDKASVTTIYSSDEWIDESDPVPLDPDLRSMLDGVHRRRVIVWDRERESATVADHPDARGMASGASIGLLRGEELIGVMNVGSSNPGTFTSDHRRLLERVGTHLSLAINNAQLYDEIKRMHLGNLKALSSALNAKDYYTLGHAARVSTYMVLLGRELGWTDEYVNQVEEAAYLHDIGKIGVPDRVLVKPAGLNTKEWEAMRQHPIFSADIIKALFDDEFVLGVRHHHERWDGNGYPDGLAATDIPVVARAMCVVDSYDAMSFQRPYKAALWYKQALHELQRCAGTQFDPEMVAAFCRVLTHLEAQRNDARAAAAEAAALIDPGSHALIRAPEDAFRPEYEEIAAILRTVRDSHPPVRYVTTHTRVGNKRFVIVVDAEESDAGRSPIGAEVFADEELPQFFAGRTPDVNVVTVDEFGVWVSGYAPIRDENGAVAAVVSADVPPAGAELEGLRSDVAQSFSSLLQTTAQRLSREALDAITDGLTGLYNHRYLHERLSEEIERSREKNSPLSLLFCDLDQFKSFNDAHGHSAGDAALRGVGRVLEGAIRHIDLAARYGGEEFVVVLFDTDLAGAIDVAERIRSEVAAAEFLPGSPVSVTVSIGVAVFPDDADRKENLIDKADWAMYLAKRRGRNQVLTFAAGQKTATPGQIGFSPSHTHLAQMAAIVDEADPFSSDRADRVAALAGRVAQDLGLDAPLIDVVVEAGRICEVGMLGLPDRLLAKDSPLSDDEWELVRGHPRTGERLVRGFGASERIAQAVAHHHERFDGTGYPAGLAGQDIPLAARIVFAAVAYEAMTTERAYRGRLSCDEAIVDLRRSAGTQLDPQVVDVLIGIVSGPTAGAEA
jgi:diguanylate cyclase (GGDEF)-like protein/excisionase family DNA binding protein